MKRLTETISVMAIVVFLSGCASIFYHPRHPILEMPDRPTLVNVSASEMNKMSVEAQQAVTQNFDKLVGYSRKLELAIDGYNDYAAEQNETLGSGEKK
jgi:hypothetical protein